MALNLDPVYIVNLVLCIVIFILGYWGYTKRRDILPLLIGLAFGLFAISHIVTIAGLSSDLNSVMVVIRTIAYLLVVFALYRYVMIKTSQGTAVPKES